MNRKSFISLLAVLLSVVFSGFAQNRPSHEERQHLYEEMRTRQLAFFTAEMGMTGDEASAFWSIYSDIQERRMRLNFQKRRALYPRPAGKRGMQPSGKPDMQPSGAHTAPPLPDDFDFEAALVKLNEIRQQEAALEEEFFIRMSEVLSPEKIFKFYRAEERWTRSLLGNFDRKF